MKYFDARRDRKRPYFCQSCIVGKTEAEMSEADPRYCLGCYEFLLEEAKLDKRWGKAAWKPISSPALSTGGKNKAVEDTTYAGIPTEVLIRTKPPQNRALQNPTHETIITLGGRPKKVIRIKEIKRLSKQGSGIRDIARELNLSASMVSRVLSGQRSS